MEIEKIISEMTLEEKAAMCSGADFWHLQDIKRLGIPRIMVTDGPHGIRKQEGEGDHLGIGRSEVAICFPTAAALAASFDRKLLKELGSILGKECQAEKIGILLGPGVNIKRSPICGRNFEYFSEDPYVSGELAAAYITGLQGEGVACSIKHFAANNQETERLSGDSVVDERTLHEIYLTSFEKSIKEAKPKTVMCAYNQLNGTFAAENKKLLTEILREDFSFDGLVVTDWGAGKDHIKGLNAGLDLRMPGGNEQDQKVIIEAVKKGELEERVINRAVENILRVIKFIVDNKQEKATFDYEGDHNKAREMAKECAVLLKNDENILPLSKKSKIAFIGEFAEMARYQGGGSSFIHSYKIDSALEFAEKEAEIVYAKGYETVTNQVDESLMEQALAAAKKSDVAVIFAGLPNAYESEGFDRKHIDMPENQNLLIEKIAAIQPNTVVVLQNGSLVAMPWADQVKGILEMYLGGEAVGSAIVELLFGDAVPSGKLAESFPYQLSDNPSYLNFPGYQGRVCYQEGVYVGYRYYDTKKMAVRYPFGHGLSYTTFAYSDIEIDKSQMTDEELLQVKVTIENTGLVAAKEIVQLYIKPIDLEMPRPEHELKGFEKVYLEPQEKKTITFLLDKRAFAYYEVRLHDWKVESGAYEVQIGASSQDIRLKKRVKIISTVEVPQVFTQYSTIGQVLGTTRGAQVFAPIMQRIKARRAENKEELDQGSGEGAEEMQNKMTMEMPLFSLVTFEVFDLNTLHEIVQLLNKKQDLS
ncbi:glycoside hydrolase family 3 C-terminal domain-containing protein [Lachnospiraceae bacterium OttesenSCG-928-D06]|nr:glycoside hydrolase family 3 C-terminal domain-containing protein [Lachnospiraceae bacterium OttesenSCG-928-D06]